MRRIFKTLPYFAFASLLLLGCEGNKTIDEIFDTVERGAVFRQLELPSADFDLFDDSSVFSITAEVEDHNNGDLLDHVDVYIGFEDNFDDGMDYSAAEQFYTTISQGEFSTGPNGFPATTFTVSMGEASTLLGVEASERNGGDNFTVRFELVLTDGRVFSSDNVGATVAGGSFFRSPFIYRPSLTCPLGDTFQGSYVLNHVTAGAFGDVWEEGVVVELDQGESEFERTFSAVYLPQFAIGNGPAAFRFTLVCGEIVVPTGQASGLQCANGITFGPPIGIPNGTYNNDDDTVITISFREDETDDCGGGVDVTVTLTRQ